MKIKPLVWVYDPAPDIMCADSYIAVTNFGRFLIQYKYWKDCNAYELVDSPWGDDFIIFNSLEETKEYAESIWQKKLKECFDA